MSWWCCIPDVATIGVVSIVGTSFIDDLEGRRLFFIFSFCFSFTSALSSFNKASVQKESSCDTCCRTAFLSSSHLAREIELEISFGVGVLIFYSWEEECAYFGLLLNEVMFRTCDNLYTLLKRLWLVARTKANGIQDFLIQSLGYTFDNFSLIHIE